MVHFKCLIYFFDSEKMSTYFCPTTMMSIKLLALLIDP